MLTIDKNGLKIDIYRSSEEMPITKYAKFQKYLIIDSGIGDNLEATGSHLSKLFEFLTYRLVDEAIQETKNLYYNFFILFEETPIKGMAFACMVHSINGVEVKDLSEDGLKATVKILSDAGITYQDVRLYTDDLKKKIHSELKRYAPNYFNDTDTIEFFANLKKKILEIEKEILTGKSDLFEVNRYFAEFSKPKDFDDDSPENEIIKVERHFEYLCAILESNGVANAKELNVSQFYIRLEYFKKLNSVKPE